MQITIEHKSSVAVGSFGAAAAQLSLQLEGRKTWLAHDRLRFETTGHNLKLLNTLWPTASVQDRRLGAEALRVLDEARAQKSPTAEPEFRLPPMEHQLKNFERFKEQPKWGIFSEQGTGKTKVAFDIICWRWNINMITGVIVLSNPKGVHSQWVYEQMPKHQWANTDILSYVWEGKKPPVWLETDTPELQFISGNLDMVKGKDGYALLQTFAKKHKGKLLFLIDESDGIKNFKSVRSKRIRELAQWTEQRAIMTGTPIAKDLTDEWGQFYFLDPSILGHKYLTTFRAQFCLMGGFEHRSVVGYQNLDQFKKITAPYIFRATKDVLNLPPKVYDEVVFDLTPTQKRLMRELRESFFATLSSGEKVSVPNGAVMLMRMQQIACGFVQEENGGIVTIDNPRLEALKELRRSICGPVIIWCRFKPDIEAVKNVFHNSGVTYYGGNSQDERDEAKAVFINGGAQELIATPGTAGRGLDGLQKVCSTSIYYSNSYKAIERWQSEDRTDRMGAIGTSTYFDLIARGSPDRGVLANLRKKKNISDLALSELEKIMEEVE